MQCCIQLRTLILSLGLVKTSVGVFLRFPTIQTTHPPHPARGNQPPGTNQPSTISSQQGSQIFAKLKGVSKQTTLRPAVINAKMVFRVGLILWAGALITLGGLHFRGVSVPGHYPAIASVGIVLGCFGYWWAHRSHLIDDDGLSQPQLPKSASEPPSESE